jgi:hypothetical protein
VFIDAGKQLFIAGLRGRRLGQNYNVYSGQVAALLAKTFSGQAPDPVAVSCTGYPLLGDSKAKPCCTGIIIPVQQRVKTVATPASIIKNTLVLGRFSQPVTAAEAECRGGLCHTCGLLMTAASGSTQ